MVRLEASQRLLVAILLATTNVARYQGQYASAGIHDLIPRRPRPLIHSSTQPTNHFTHQATYQLGVSGAAAICVTINKDFI